MRYSAMITLTLLSLCLNLPTNAALAQEQTVTVVADGYSYLGDNDTIKTGRERALAEAERNAVEQGSYSYLESQTTVKNYQVTTDEIKSRVKGVITSKKILVDEMEKDTLRYHIRLEAEVKVGDVNAIIEQQDDTPSSLKDSQAKVQTAPTPSNVILRRPSKAHSRPVPAQIRRLRNEHPYRYIQLMTRIQPQLDNTEVFIARLHRVKPKHPEAGRKIKSLLKKTPIEGRGTSTLAKRLRFLKKKRPRDYILMMEILYPEVRPPAMERYWLRMREADRRALSVVVTPSPVK